jgi:hypothetical protein
LPMLSGWGPSKGVKDASQWMYESGSMTTLGAHSPDTLTSTSTVLWYTAGFSSLASVPPLLPTRCPITRDNRECSAAGWLV